MRLWALKFEEGSKGGSRPNTINWGPALYSDTPEISSYLDVMVVTQVEDVIWNGLPKIPPAQHLPGAPVRFEGRLLHASHDRGCANWFGSSDVLYPPETDLRTAFNGAAK